MTNRDAREVGKNGLTESQEFLCRKNCAVVEFSSILSMDEIRNMCTIT